MEFNIKDSIAKLKKRTEQLRPHKEKEIAQLLESFGVKVDPSNISFYSGILSFKNTSPTLVTSIKIKKADLQKKAAQKNIIIRDII